jgi:glycosyltransferase involved in cell wall biosynthesis
MDPLKVSIIVNNYNYARFLRGAIDSALAQTCPDCEVVVVDDGSTDDSRGVIESYGSRVRAIYKANGGQASAINAGFAASSGEIVLFLDADDVLFPEAAAAIVSAWRAGVVRIQFTLEVVDALGNRSGKRVGGSGLADATTGPFGGDSPTSGNAFSRAVLEKIMPVPEDDWRICADKHLTIASSLFGEVMPLGRPLGYYRVHGSNNHAGAAGLARLRRELSGDFKLHSSLCKLAPGAIAPLESWLNACPQHWVGRITSLRESPDDHPWPDALPALMRKALSATWRHRYWNVRRKAAYSLWIVAYATAPRKIALALKGLEGRGSGALPQLLLGRDSRRPRTSEQ